MREWNEKNKMRSMCVPGKMNFRLLFFLFVFVEMTFYCDMCVIWLFVTYITKYSLYSHLNEVILLTSEDTKQMF